MTAPVASGWSLGRVGLEPTGKRRLFTAHTHCGNSNLRYASSRPDVDYGLSPARVPPLWDDCDDAQTDDGSPPDRYWELAYIKNKLLKKVNIMELSEHILKDAQQALASGLMKLPWQIPSAPGFFLANKDDQKIMAFGSVMHDGVYYKVGVKRE